MDRIAGLVMVVASSAVLFLAGCGGPDCCTSVYDAGIDVAHPVLIDAPIVAPVDASTIGGVCNPLTQAGCTSGEKCTWIVDALTPSYSGHVACAPAGAAQAGQPCMYGAPGPTGYDNCAAGLVCGNYRGGTGTCKTICDAQGGTPACPTTGTCVTYDGLFVTGQFTPAAGGVCDQACNPLEDNDFDGSGTLTKGSNVCGSAASAGCYGYPSYGTPPATGWSCTNDINFDKAQPIGLRHRVACNQINSCAGPGPTIYVNSCNQGYLPLLYESTGSTVIICVALCKPLNCYAGNCGVDGANRLGAAPHRCTATDAVGTFNTASNGEHCQFLWMREVDDAGNFLPSPTSDTVGVCFDMSKYRYDSNGDNKLDTADQTLPSCAQLQDGYGSGSNAADPLTYFGAADLGCVDSTRTTMQATGKPHTPRGRQHVTTRPLYRAQRTQ